MLLLPPSLTASGEPHPLPMERTFLTASVVVCASMEDRWPRLQGVGVITRVGSRWRSSSASIVATHFSRGADGTGGTGSTVPRSAVVVLAKYQGRLGSARVSAAGIARDDIMETD
jgi:hypothetical protein